MPKIVDHDKQRAEIIEKAAPVFSEYGYSGLGMRQIAEHLSMSKSALYHYFPSKEELFSACTKFVIGRDEQRVLTRARAETKEMRLRGVMKLVAEVEENFQAEMYLLMDYVRGRTARDIAHDKNMRHANRKYLEMVAHHVGPEKAPKVLVLIMGALMQRLLDGKRTPMRNIERWISDLI